MAVFKPIAQMHRRAFLRATGAAITGVTVLKKAVAAERDSPDSGIPLRPLNTNFYGAFLTPPGGNISAMWEGPRYLDAQTAQVDAIKSIRGNLVCSFLDCAWAVNGHHSLTLNSYLARVKELADYIASMNMYWLPYCSYSMHYWNDGVHPLLTNTAAIPILVAEAQLLSQYSNVVGMVLNDEPFTNDAEISFAPALGAQYVAVKNVVPDDFPVSVASNPCGNIASSRGNAMSYSAASKNLFDSIAQYQDFMCFNPQAANVTSDMIALITAYPTKQIVFGGGNAASDDIGAAARAAALIALVGANNVRLYSQFAVLDFAGTAFGMFNDDYTPRRARTDAFTIAIAVAAFHHGTSP